MIGSTAKTIKKLMNARTAVALLVLAIPPLLAASGAGEAGEHGAHGSHGGGLPTEVILQFVNFGIYAVALLYFLRQPVRSYFSARQENFKQALLKAEQAKAQAENQRREIQERLTKLESTRDESIAQARSEAAALKKQIIEEAKALSEKLQQDAKRTAEIELERARLALRQDLLAQSVQLAQKLLADKDKLQDQDQKRLQSEFVGKIQVVSQ